MRPSPSHPRLATLGLAAMLLAPVATPAAASDAAEADRLRGLLESYLGAPAPGQPGAVAVTPVGDGYELAIDLDRLAAPLRGLGLDLKLGRNVSRLTPKSDGTWTWTSDRFEPMTWAVTGQTGRLALEGWRATGTFSPTLGAFGDQTTSIDKMVSEQTVAAHDEVPRIDIRRVDEGITMTMTAKPAASGTGIDATVDRTTRSSTNVFSLSEGTAAGIPDMEATLKIGPSRVVADVTGWRNEPVLALWRHLVAHHDKADFTTGQADLKARLRALGPVFERMKQTASVDRVEIETPVGFGGVGHLEATIDMTGAAADGDADVTVALGGFELHSLFIPAWASRLVPRDLTVHGKVGGWDAAAALAIFLDRADFAAEKPIDDATAAEMLRRALPKGVVTVDLAGNHVASNDWDVTLDGRLSLGPAGADGDVTIRAKGLEAAVTALRDPAAGEAGRKAADELAIALSFAENSDGALVWRFALRGKDVSVNGRSIGGSGAKPL